MADDNDFVMISSSGEEDDECSELDESEEDRDLSGHDSDWSGEDETESDIDYNGLDDVEDEDGGGDKFGGDDNDSVDADVDSVVNKVILFLKEGCSLKALKITECKAYLRDHGLRLTGSKAVCLERILEHWRIKDGKGEAVYPSSSFVINCKGDVCKGDVVLFRQKVYQNFEKMKRHGKLMGTRTVAGKVVKESYGAAKQQHTFTIEVLWSKGAQKLPPLHPLLVKGRNLYRLRTFRQPWGDEAERLKVLSEKHNRGAAARQVRVMRKEREMQSANLRRRKKDEKHQQHKKSYQTRKTTEGEKGKHAKGQGKALSQVVIHTRQENRMQNSPAPAHSCASRAFNPRTYAPSSYAFPAQHCYGYRNRFNQRHPLSYSTGSTSNAMGSTSFNPYADTSAITVSHHGRPYGSNYSHHEESNPCHGYGVRDLDRFCEMMISHRPVGEQPYEQRRDRFRPNDW